MLYLFPGVLWSSTARQCAAHLHTCTEKIWTEITKCATFLYRVRAAGPARRQFHCVKYFLEIIVVCTISFFVSC